MNAKKKASRQAAGGRSKETKSTVTKRPARTDRRIKRTRDALGDALIALMHEKKFDDITVQHVLDRAGVGRSTFYAHYRDKEDLFMSDVEEFFAMISSALKRNKADPRRLAPVREFLAHLRDVRDFHAAMVASGKLNDVLELGRGFFSRSMDERLQAAGVEADSVRRAAQAHALAGSLFSLVDWWISKGMKPDPAEMDELFHRMAWKGLETR